MVVKINHSYSDDRFRGKFANLTEASLIEMVLNTDLSRSERVGAGREFFARGCCPHALLGTQGGEAFALLVQALTSMEAIFGVALCGDDWLHARVDEIPTR